MSARDLRTCPPTVPALGEGNWVEAGVVAATLGLSALLFLQPYNEVSSLWIATVTITALVVWIIAQDLKTFTIADGADISLGILAVASRLSAGDTTLAIAMDGLLTGGALLIFREVYYRSRGFDGLGLGDVKLAASGGLLVGALTFAWVLFAASLLALCFFVARRLLVGASASELDRPERLAFGAALAPVILVAWTISNLPILLPSVGF